MELDVHKNKMTGILPASLGKSTTLGKSALDQVSFLLVRGAQSVPIVESPTCKTEHIDMSENSFSGSMPTEWTNLPELVSLMVQHNEITGSVPTGAGWRKLKHLWLNGNSLQGSIPDGMGQLTDLVDMFLEDNVSLWLANNALKC